MKTFTETIRAPDGQQIELKTECFYFHLASPPDENFLAMIGKANLYEFHGAPPDTLLINSVHGSDVCIAFLKTGWNHFYVHSSKKFERILFNGKLAYESCDFSNALVQACERGPQNESQHLRTSAASRSSD